MTDNMYNMHVQTVCTKCMYKLNVQNGSNYKLHLQTTSMRYKLKHNSIEK